MMKLTFAQIDAFADAPFSGNPAAVMPLDHWLDDGVLQAIAAENNLSETAFLIPLDGADADFELRWFTPTAEVALCGHATLASGHYVLSTQKNRESVTFQTRKSGVLEVARDGSGRAGHYAMALPAIRATPKALPAIIAALGLDDAVETLWHPGGYALIVVAEAAQVAALSPDFRALASGGDVLTIVTAPGEQSDVISRVFAPGVGVDEDPVTGSAHCVLAPYWADRLGRADFAAFQASKRGGRIGCRLDGDRVVLTGACVSVIDGKFLLP